MRYDTPIFFQLNKPGEYDETTGNYGKATVEETMVLASVMDTGVETLKLIYGSLKQGSLTIHIQNHYDYAFDFIRIGDKKYRVDHHRKLRTKETFIVSEVQR